MSNISISARLRRNNFTLDCRLDFPDSGVTAILGPSGSGKTTLLRILAGLEKADSGYIDKAGVSWFDSDKNIFIKPQKRKVGVVFQDYALFEHMSVADNVGFGLKRRERQRKVAYWLDKVHLSDLSHRFPHQLSGGQRQRVALARALITEPDLLLLDEPFSALDTHLRQTLRQQLLAVVADIQQPVLMVTHDLNEARYLADTVAVMIDGNIEHCGPTHNVFNRPATLQSARVLGWKNILTVHKLSGQCIEGHWGRICIRKECPVDTDYVAIRPEHIKIDSDNASINARLVRIIELDGYRELQCQLDDGSSLYLHRPWNELLPLSGTQLKLELPEQHLCYLGDTINTYSNTMLSSQLPAAESGSNSGYVGNAEKARVFRLKSSARS